MFLKTITFPSWDLIGCNTKRKLSQLTFVKNAYEFQRISFGQWLQRQKSKALKFRRKAEAHGTAEFRCLNGTQSAKSNADGQYIESLLDLTVFFFLQHNVLSKKSQKGDKIPSRYLKAK